MRAYTARKTVYTIIKVIIIVTDYEFSSTNEAHWESIPPTKFFLLSENLTLIEHVKYCSTTL